MQISRHWRMKALRYRLEGINVVRANPNESTRNQPPRVEAQEPQPNQPVVVKRATAAR